MARSDEFAHISQELSNVPLVHSGCYNLMITWRWRLQLVTLANSWTAEWYCWFCEEFVLGINWTNLLFLLMVQVLVHWNMLLVGKNQLLLRTQDELHWKS